MSFIRSRAVQVTDGNGRRRLVAGACLFVAGVWSLLSIVIAEGMNSSYNVSSESVSGLGVPYFSHIPVTCTALPSCAIPVQPSSAVIVLSFFVAGAFGLVGGYLLRKATSHRLFSLGIAVVGACSFLVGVSYVPFYLGTPTIGVIDATEVLHGIGSFGVFILAFILAIYAYRFARGPFRYLSPILGVLMLASLLLGFSGDYLGVGFGGMERVLIYCINIWILGFGSYLLGGPELG